MAKSDMTVELKHAMGQELAGEHFFETLNKESDLPCALVAASHIDGALKSLLSCHFQKCGTAESILNFKGVLGSIFTRNQVAYCLELISQSTFKNVVKLAEIRNVFAHKEEDISFDHPDVVAFLNDMTYPIPDLFSSQTTSNRDKFVLVSIFLLVDIQLAAARAKKIREDKEKSKQSHLTPQ